MILPERIIQKAIAHGMNLIRSDSKMLESMFRNLDQQTLSNMKEYIRTTKIDFSINYPEKEALQVPALVLVLRSEQEAETFLGDHMGTFPNNEVPYQDMTVDTDGGHGGSVSDLGGLSRPVGQGLEVSYSSANRLFIGDDSLEYYVEDVYPEMLEASACTLHVVSGTGAGQVYEIISVSNSSIDIEDNFSVDLDSSSVVDIRVLESISTDGEPSTIYSTPGMYVRSGVHYDTQYQLQVIAGQQEEVIYLYAITKALLLMQRPYLEGQGLMVMKMSGSDFAPRGEYLPSNVFMRVLNLQFTYPFSFIEEISSPTAIEIYATPDELGSPGSGQPIFLGRITL
jgi:hypothetical protein